MSDSTFNKEILARAEMVAKLVISKQKDYGKKNILNSVIDPKLAVAVRLQDKVARIANLAEGDQPLNHESLLDTAHDIVGYGLILTMLIDGSFDLEIK